MLEELFYKDNRETPQFLDENHGKYLHKAQEIICVTWYSWFWSFRKLAVKGYMH